MGRIGSLGGERRHGQLEHDGPVPLHGGGRTRLHQRPGRRYDLFLFQRRRDAVRPEPAQQRRAHPFVPQPLQYFRQCSTRATTTTGTKKQVFGATGRGETLALDQTELDVMQALGWTSLAEAGRRRYFRQLGDPHQLEHRLHADRAAGRVHRWRGTVSLDSNVIVNSIATSLGRILLIGNNAPTTLTAVQGTDLNSEDSSSVASGNLGDIFVYTGSALQIGYVSDTFRQCRHSWPRQGRRRQRRRRS